MTTRAIVDFPSQSYNHHLMVKVTIQYDDNEELFEVTARINSMLLIHRRFEKRYDAMKFYDDLNNQFETMVQTQ